MTLNEINRETPEGRLLFTALAILTTTDELVIAGEPVQGTSKTPYEMLDILEESAKVIDEANKEPAETN